MLHLASASRVRCMRPLPSFTAMRPAALATAAPLPHCAPAVASLHTLSCPSFFSSSRSRLSKHLTPLTCAPPRAAMASSSHTSSNSALFEPPPTLEYTQRIPRKKSSFRDRVRLHVSGGRGGTGCSSYDRDPYGKGGPDGANGGRGGDVFLVASEALSMLGFDSFHLRAQNGQAGGSNRSKGRNGHSLHVPVPAGTVVSEILATDPSSGEYRLRFLADLDRHGLMLQVARGGSGGLGNRAFRTEYRKQARFSTVGRPGEARWLWLELKCIADVGLVGYPNAGKSSFLAAVSNATPEIANYPFTTLAPQVGVVEEERWDATAAQKQSPQQQSPDSASSLLPGGRLHVADLPGLISGAASNRGLGHEFLKHIQRTRVLAFVLDVAAEREQGLTVGSGTSARSSQRRSAVDDFRSLIEELRAFDHTLLNKPAVLLLNKVDDVAPILDATQDEGQDATAAAGKKRGKKTSRKSATSTASVDAAIARVTQALQGHTHLPIYPISCRTGAGLPQAMHALFALTREVQAKEEAARAQLAQELAQEDAELRRQALQEQSQAEAEAPLVDIDEAEWTEDVEELDADEFEEEEEEAVASPPRAAKSKQSAKPAATAKALAARKQSASGTSKRSRSAAR